MKKIGVGVFIENHPNKNRLTLHSRCRLIEDNDGDEWESGYISDDNREMDGVRPLTQAIVTQLRRVKGVKDVSIWPYETRIGKSPTYSWEEILPAVTKIFATYIPVEDF